MNLWSPIFILLVIVYVGIKLYRNTLKHSAILNAFNAKYTLENLPVDEKDRVIKKVVEIIVRSGLIEEDLDDMSELVKFWWVGTALRELGIPPNLPEELWCYNGGIKNPFISLVRVNHLRDVVKHHFLKQYGVRIDMDCNGSHISFH